MLTQYGMAPSNEGAVVVLLALWLFLNYTLAWLWLVPAAARAGAAHWAKSHR